MTAKKANLRERPGRADRAARRAGNAARRAPGAESTLRLSVTNGILAAAGVSSVVLGYWFLGQGSITAAPLLLVLGYVVLLPLAIIK